LLYTDVLLRENMYLKNSFVLNEIHKVVCMTCRTYLRKMNGLSQTERKQLAKADLPIDR